MQKKDHHREGLLAFIAEAREKGHAVLPEGASIQSKDEARSTPPRLPAPAPAPANPLLLPLACLTLSLSGLLILVLCRLLALTTAN